MMWGQRRYIGEKTCCVRACMRACVCACVCLPPFSLFPISPPIIIIIIITNVLLHT